VRPDGGKGLLPVGVMAPEVVGVAADGGVSRLSACRGHEAVVYFYPKDGTPGCTKEACAFRDAFERYEALHVTIFGVSRDSAASHVEFRASEKLPYSLVSDGDGAISRAYGVGSTFGMDSRVTFLVNAEGRVAEVWPDVDPGVHANQVLAAVTALHSAQLRPAGAVPSASP
jgi:peroxiredoxin Q/BCP